MGLDPAEREFLECVRDGRPLGLADRAQDRVRQRCRNSGLAKVVKNPRRWVLTEAGRTRRRIEPVKHAREDYNRIQDPAGLIPDDEPVFLLRGQDRSAPYAVAAWARDAELNGASPEIVEAARQQCNRMMAWQTLYVKKVPDMPAPKED